MKKKIASILILGISVMSLAACDSSDYKKAMSLYESGEYEEAAKMFVELGDYEDSADMAMKAEEYLDYMSFSYSGLVDQLEFEGFTHSQAEYGASEAY